MSPSGRDGTGRVRTTVRSQLWPLPVAGVVAAVALGVGLPQLDAAFDGSLPDSVTGYLFGGGPSAARTVLDAIASTLITVTALTFSLTVVTLQLASSQFSPRLLRTFSRDRFVHVTLALFLSTFTYSLTVLRTVRESDDAQAAFVPQVAVTVAFGLALVSVLGLVLFLAHLAREIRVERMLDNVHRAASTTLRDALDDLEQGGGHDDGREGPAPTASTPGRVPVPPPDAAPLPAASSGFVVHIDEAAVLAAALDAGAVIWLDSSPGSSVVTGTPMGVAWPQGAGPIDAPALSRLRDRVAAAVATGIERTEVQDIGYGLRQLTDVANKALSPGINDPTTAVHALGHISSLLCELAHRNLGPRLLHDDERVRVVLTRPDLAELLEAAIGQPRRYGAADALVLERLLQLLRELAWTVTAPAQRQAVTEQLARLRATAAAQDFDTTTALRLERLAGRVDDALTGRWTPGPVLP